MQTNLLVLFQGTTELESGLCFVVIRSKDGDRVMSLMSDRVKMVMTE